MRADHRIRLFVRRAAPDPGLVHVDETLSDTMMRLDRLPPRLKAAVRRMIATLDVSYQTRLQRRIARKTARIDTSTQTCV